MTERMNSDEIIRRGQEYQQMCDTEGWKDLKKTLDAIVSGAQRQWLVNDNVDPELRIYAKAYERVGDIVKARIELGKKRASEKAKGTLPKPREKARSRKRKVIV